MRLGLACIALVAPLLAAVMGCNALTGVSDLEPVDCVGACDEPDARIDATPDAADAAADSRADAAPDAITDAAPDAITDADAAADADASDAPADTRPDVGCVLNAQCNDDNACTKDLCNGIGVCTNPIDDGDGDGEASIELGACGLDCHDGNPDVFSAQTEFFATPYTVEGGVTSFDYDCNGVQEREHTSAYKCTRSGSTCIVTPGWSGTVPACGASGTWVGKCTYLSLGSQCLPSTTKVVQRCR